MRRVLEFVYVVALFAAVGVGMFALFNWIDGKQRPLWTGAVFAVFCCFIGPQLMQFCVKRGWIEGVFWHIRPELEKKKRELAEEREKIIREAKAKGG